MSASSKGKPKTTQHKLSLSLNHRDVSGINNPMYGKKHTEETKILIGSKSVNRNWNKPNHFGVNNPNAKKVLIETESGKKYYECLKDYYNEHKTAPYSTLKSIARGGRFSKKYGIKISYV